MTTDFEQTQLILGNLRRARHALGQLIIQLKLRDGERIAEEREVFREIAHQVDAAIEALEDQVTPIAEVTPLHLPDFHQQEVCQVCGRRNDDRGHGAWVREDLCAICANLPMNGGRP